MIYALTVVHVLLPVTNVLAAVWIGHHALAVILALKPVTIVLTAIRKFEHSFALPQIFFVLAHILSSIRVVINTGTVLLVVQILAIVF